MVGRKSHEGRPLGASSILPSGLHLPYQPWLRGSHGQDRREGRGPYRSNSGHEEPPAKEPVGSPTLPARPPTGSFDSPRAHHISTRDRGSRVANGYRFFTWDCHLFFHRIVVSAPFRHTTNWREGNTALGDGSQCGIGIRASFRLGSGRGPRPPREQYACFIARHSRGLRPFRVALLILDSRLAPTTSTVRGGPGQHMEKRINPSTSGRV